MQINYTIPKVRLGCIGFLENSENWSEFIFYADADAAALKKVKHVYDFDKLLYYIKNLKQFLPCVLIQNSNI